MQLKSSLISFNHHFDSPVIPTKRKPKLLEVNSLGFFYIPNWRIFGVIQFVMSGYQNVFAVVNFYSTKPALYVLPKKERRFLVAHDRCPHIIQV